MCSSDLGYVNTWWVFGEVAPRTTYKVFMAEAENIGYKRTKRGEKELPNELFTLEYAPQKLNVEKIHKDYKDSIITIEEQIEKEKTKKEKEKREGEKKRRNNLCNVIFCWDNKLHNKMLYIHTVLYATQIIFVVLIL